MEQLLSVLLKFVWDKNVFIIFYGVMGTLSHSKIILELLLQNDKPDGGLGKRKLEKFDHMISIVQKFRISFTL